MLKNKSRYLVLYGGAGSGKSVFAAQKILLRILIEKNHKVLVLRKVANTNRNSTFSLFIGLLQQVNLYKFAKINRTVSEIHIPIFNSSIIFTGLDDVEKLKSIHGVTLVWCEETSEMDEKDLDQLDIRLRDKTQFYKQILITFNPIDERHWLKKKFFDDPPQNSYWKKTTYLDNEFLDDEYKSVLENNFRNNPNFENIYRYGNWGKTSFGGEFYKDFSLQRHVVKNLSYDPTKPIHITFDFNVLPYSACLIWQIDLEKKAVYCIREICLKPPNNRIRNVLNKIKEIYFAHKSGVYYYGDPAGDSESTLVEKGITNFTIIAKELSFFGAIPRVFTSSYPVKTSAMFIDALFRGDLGINIFFDNLCNESINDYLYLQEDSEGKELKKKVKDKNTGKMYEELGHITAANRYFFTAAFEPLFQKYLTNFNPQDIKVNFSKTKRNNF